MKLRFIPLLIFTAFLMGCSRVGAPVPDLPGEPSLVLATVEDVEVVMLMSFPLQVHLQVKGYVGDPCTAIDEVDIEREGYDIKVLIKTKRDSELACIQVIEPFEENVPLDVYGLPAGDYTVDVNGFETSFTFFQDNILEP